MEIEGIELLPDFLFTSGIALCHLPGSAWMMESQPK
jgi:hypothetical protein